MRIVAAAAALWLAACLGADVEPCADGTVCAAGLVCVPGGCADPARVTVCEGAGDGEACSAAAIVDGVCRAGLCVDDRCGDGVIDPGEVCDDGNTDPGDGCNATCTSDERCGNGVVELAEACDCGDAAATIRPAVCAGRANDGVVCRAACTLPFCGDGEPNAAEACDDGNLIAGDACDPLCRVEACGNGRVDLGEDCELGDAGCRGDCTQIRCGDGTLDPLGADGLPGGGDDEVCDDGNLQSADGCNADCSSDESCGNGFIDPGEACDDGNQVNGDGCQWSRGGSGGPELELCIAQRCGDGIPDPAGLDQLEGTGDDEICDDGNLAAGDGCAPDCRSDETCGNGVVDFARAEQCDDGNAIARDGCSLCVPEPWLMGRGGASGLRRATGAYDPHAGRALVFSGQGQLGANGSDVQTWGGGEWAVAANLSVVPPVRYDAAMAYDATRGEAVLFGGTDGSTAFGDTWAWTSTEWIERFGTTVPPPRSAHVLVHDPARGVTVLFGGYDAFNDLLADTWTWDGATWTERTPPTRPAPRSAAMAGYDPVRGRVVLFGGVDETGLRNDTWLWDGDAWTETAVGAGPAARRSGGLAFSVVNQRLVLFGGIDAVAPRGDTWTWDGAAWQALTPPTSPAARGEAVLTAEPGGGVLLFAGRRNNVSQVWNDAWRWDGTTWHAVSLSAASMLFGVEVAAAPVRGKVVALGGSGIGFPAPSPSPIWERDRHRGWAKVFGSDERRSGHTLATAADGRSVVSWGGADGTGPATAHLRMWDGLAVTGVDPDPAPLGRIGAALFTGPTRAWVFGGEGASGVQASTWVFEDADDTWTELPTLGPSARKDALTAYDAARDEWLVFGGLGAQVLGDTWAWDGAAWTPRATTGPLPRFDGAAWFDPLAEQVLVLGGNRGSADVGDLWSWDGAIWRRELERALGTYSLHQGAVAYDAADARAVGVGDLTLLTGGLSNVNAQTFTLERFSTVPREVCAVGVDADGDGLEACADPECWGVCSPLCAPPAAAAGRCDPLDPALPHCGDGACGDVESCRSCPGDCGSCAPVCGDAFCDPGESSTGCPGDCA